VRFFRLEEALGPVDLIDARSGDPRVARYWRDDFDLDQGTLFIHRGRVHYGADAVNLLAGLSRPSGFFNKLNRLALSDAGSAAVFYPLLKLGRRLILAARGKTALSRPADLA
jgi:hypothetical protein